MNNIKIVIQYDGSQYHGWQIQENAHTIQQQLIDAIHALTGEYVNLIGSGRTDAGVHALKQVANFKTSCRIPPDKLLYPLNDILPKDIRVIHSSRVPDTFHARYDAIKKVYVYRIYNKETPCVFETGRAFWVKKRLDVNAMQEAAAYVLGEHDFAAFCASGSEVKTTIRRVYESTVTSKKDTIVCYRVVGNGFLYHMVRILVGTLVDVGLGKFKADHMLDILMSKDRKRAGKTAPAQGLYLTDVQYDSDT